jgi:hypothetical protein
MRTHETGHYIVAVWKSWESPVCMYGRQFHSCQNFCRPKIQRQGIYGSRLLNKHSQGRDEKDQPNSINLGTSLEDGTKAVASFQQG